MHGYHYVLSSLRDIKVATTVIKKLDLFSAFMITFAENFKISWQIFFTYSEWKDSFLNSAGKVTFFCIDVINQAIL